MTPCRPGLAEGKGFERARPWRVGKTKGSGMQWIDCLGALVIVALGIEAARLKVQARRLKTEVKALRLARRYNGKGRSHE